MPEAKTRLLFVDDEENIRLTLGIFLESQGFLVTSAATVPEALRLISQQQFDVLLADLNVGAPGDGFTVVSAMRRTQPKAVTFILTGYPAFDTALEAIRLQVDDYVTKPADIEELVVKIRSKLLMPGPEHRMVPKRLAQIISENVQSITDEWLKLCVADPDLAVIPISKEERSDHVPRVLLSGLQMVHGQGVSSEAAEAARAHGVLRREQSFTIPLLLRETRLLHDTIARCVQGNLLAVEVSYLITDMMLIQQAIQILLEASVSAFLNSSEEIRS